VVLPDNDRRITVVDRTDFVASMDRFFAEVQAGAVALAEPGTSAASPTTGNARRDVLWRWAWTRPGRWIAEHLVRSPRQLLRYVLAGPQLPMQVRSEILGLLERLQVARPRFVLEIGTGAGGTSYLLSRVAAADGLFVTCCLHAPPITASWLRRGNRRRQSVDVLSLDTHTADARRLLHERFPDGVDVLFIDGDHSYEGVRQDFLDYADLLRPRSLLVFHDIVEDYRTRYAITTGSWVGGVPRFWRELRSAAPSAFRIEEHVNSPLQDGMGIGTLTCPDVADPGRVLRAALVGGPHE
jgi:predicted O-methyltransferase YrrM